MSQKLFKRALAFVLTFAMLLSNMTLGTTATLIKLSVGSVEPVTVGSEVTVPVSLSAVSTPVCGLQFKVTYDTEVLTYKTFDAGSLLVDETLDINVETAGTVGVAYVTINNPISSDGKVCDITFNAIKTTNESVISISDVAALDANGDDVTVTCEGGIVIVEQGAQPSYTITGSEVFAVQGETATVDFVVSNNTLTDVKGIDFDISYDASVLTVTEADVVKGSLLSDATMDVNVEERGKAGVMGVSTTDIVSGNGTLVSVTFTVKEDAAVGESSVGLSVEKMIDSNTQVITARGNIVEGKVVVTVAEVLITPTGTWDAYKWTDVSGEIEFIYGHLWDEDKSADENENFAKCVNSDGSWAIGPRCIIKYKNVDLRNIESITLDTNYNGDMMKLGDCAVTGETTEVTYDGRTYQYSSNGWKPFGGDGVTSWERSASDNMTFLVPEASQVENATFAIMYNNSSSPKQIKSLTFNIMPEKTPEEKANNWKTAYADILATAVDSVAITDEFAIESALTAYEALADDVKALVAVEKQLLDSLKDKIAQLKEEQAPVDKTETEKQIEEFLDSFADTLTLTIDTVTVSDKASVEEAQTELSKIIVSAGYEYLDDDMKNTLADVQTNLEALKDRIKALEDQAGGNPGETPGGTPGGGTVSDPVIFVPGIDATIDDAEQPSMRASIMKVSRNIVAGQKGKLPYNVDEDVVTVTYTSSDEDVATVSTSGTITSKKAGKTKITITVTKNGVSAQTILTLHVKAKKKVPKKIRNYGRVFMTENGTPVIEVNKDMKVGGTSSIKAVVEDDTTQVSYESKNGRIAKVTKSGKIIGLRSGTTNVVASVKSKDIVEKYRVKVIVKN